jgi:hypothetical protein
MNPDARQRMRLWRPNTRVVGSQRVGLISAAGQATSGSASTHHHLTCHTFANGDANQGAKYRPTIGQNVANR